MVLNNNHTAVPIKDRAPTDDCRELAGNKEHNCRRGLSSHLEVSEKSHQQSWTCGLFTYWQQHIVLDVMHQSLILQTLSAGMGFHSTGNLPLMVRLKREGHATFWNGSQQNRQLRITSPYWIHWIGCDWFKPLTAGHSVQIIKIFLYINKKWNALTEWKCFPLCHKQ